MAGNRTKSIVAGLVFLAALGSFWITVVGPGPKFDPDPHLATGEVLAEEAAKAAAGGGAIILIARDTTLFKSPAHAAVLAGFFKTLKSKGNKVSLTNLVQLDPLRVPMVPPGDFYEILRRRDERDVVVSLLGPPALSPEQRTRLGEKRPRVIAFCPGPMARQANLKELFEQQLVQAAIISRSAISMAPPQIATSRAWFDHLYQVITAENLSALPVYQEGKAP